MSEEKTPVGTKTKIYWSHSEKYKIANWVPEIKEAGHITRPEESLTFHSHIKTTDDKKMQRFIEGSRGFGYECIEVASLEEARKLTAQQNQMKRVSKLMSTDISRQEVDVATLQNETAM